MKKTYLRIACLLLVLVCCFSLCACATSTPEPTTKMIKVPNIENLDPETAKTLIASKGLIPTVEYEYNNDYDYDKVIRTYPTIGSEVEEDTPIRIYISQGPKYYKLEDTSAVGWIANVKGIDPFVWKKESPDGRATKWFYNLYAQEGYLYITIGLRCTSEYSIEFYGDFGTASINDTFDKTVPIKLLYDSAIVNNKGETTEVELKIPLTDLGVQKPTNIYVEFDFLVNNTRQTLEAGFNLTW